MRKAMNTRQRRVNVTFRSDTLKAVSLLADKKEMSLSSMTQELVEQALELREDIHLSHLADVAEKRAKGKKTVPADRLWKKLGIK